MEQRHYNLWLVTYLKLNLGCGLEYKKGYANIDAFDDSVADKVMSALNLEFEDNTFTQVDCIQVLEHLGAAKSIYALAEMYRVLTPKGLLLIETPDLKNSFKIFLKGNENQRKLVMNWIYGLDMPGMSHKYGFPEELLERMLLETGFVDIEITRVDTKSAYPSLRATSRKEVSMVHQFFGHFRKNLLQTKLVDLDNQVDVIEKEVVIQELLETALNSKNSSQHLNKMLKATSTSSPEIGYLYLETAISHNLVSHKEASNYLRVLKELVSLRFTRVMTHLFQEMPVIPGHQNDTFETIKSMCELSVEKLLSGEQAVIDELRSTSEKIDEEIQSDLFCKTALEMVSRSQLALGAKAFVQERLDEAITHYDKAIRFNRDSILAYWNLARIRSLNDTQEKASHCYDATKELLKLQYPKLHRAICKKIDDEIDYITRGNRKQINDPVLSLHRLSRAET
jgi:predicted SAM-dependent methyltransferase